MERKTYISTSSRNTQQKQGNYQNDKTKAKNAYDRTYPNMRSIHSCKCAETCSLSRAILCLCMKSTGFSAQGGNETESGNSYEIKRHNICCLL